MIIQVKLKPFRDWPCYREGLLPTFACRENSEKLSGVDLEVDGAVHACPFRKGYAWRLTLDSIQRLYAVGGLGPFAIISRNRAHDVFVCQHIIESPSVLWIALRGDLHRYGLWKDRPKRDTSIPDWRVGKFFLRDWSQSKWSAVWMGSIVQRLGNHGWPVYLVRLFPGCEPMYGDADEYYLASLTDVTQWHLYDSEAEMMTAYESFRRHAAQPQDLME